MEEKSEWLKPNGLLSGMLILVLWSIILCCIVLSRSIASTLFYCTTVFLIGTCQRYLEEISHQAMHRNLFLHVSLNDKLDLFYAIPLFYTIKEARLDHYKHHTQLREEQATKNYSYDHLGVSNQWIHKRGYKKFILFIQPFLGTQAVIECKNIAGGIRKYFLPCYLYHFILIMILFYFHQVNIYWYYWLIPYFTVHCLFYYYSELFTHFGCRGKYLSRDTRQWFVKWFLGPLGFCHYHSLHHLYPKIPWNQYSHVMIFYEKNQQTLRQTFKEMLSEPIQMLITPNQ